MCLITAAPLHGQTPEVDWGGFRLMSVDGQVDLEGQYRLQSNLLQSGATERPRTSDIRGRLMLTAQSYIMHPNFILLDANLDYRPGTRRERFINQPNRSEFSTAEKFGIRSTIFNKRALSFNIYGNVNHQYINRDLATNVELFRTGFGNRLNLRNSALPLTVSYDYENSREKQLQTGREFKNRRISFNSRMKKSFTELDDHQLTLSHIDYQRRYVRIDTVRNRLTTLNLRNRLLFDTNGNRHFNSYVLYNLQEGDIPFRRWQVNENMYLELPEQFALNTSYQFVDYRQNSFDSRQHRVTGQLEHKLYLSLRSSLRLEYSRLNQDAFDETQRTLGLNLEYKKRIPTGRVTFSYDFRLRGETQDNDELIVRVVNEAHRLNDGDIVLLDKPFVPLGSVIVKDETESITYSESFDYVLIERGDFLEIQRLPGGLIANGDDVLIDYSTQPQSSFDFDSISHKFGMSFSLLKNHLDLYYRSHELDHGNLQRTDRRVFKKISRRVYGARASYGILSGGAELDDTDSNVVPIRSTRLFATLTGYLFNRLTASLTGDIQKNTLKDDDEKQTFANLSGRAFYRVGRKSKIDFEGSYVFQEGRGLDLNLISFQGEFSTYFRQINLILGFGNYRRSFSGERTNFSRMYMRVERKL